MQPTAHLEFRMNASTVLIALAVGLIGMHTTNANRESIAPKHFGIGNTASFVYTAPSTGKIFTYFTSEDNDIPFMVAYRVNSKGDVNTLFLNSRKGGVWGTGVRITGITTTPGTIVKILIKAEENAYTITFNGKQVATFNYRINKPVANIVYDSGDYDSVLKALTVLY